MARRSTGTAQGREGPDAAQRRAGSTAAGVAVGPNRKRLPLRDRRRKSVPRGSLQRTFATRRLPLHVWTRLHHRLPGVLGDSRQFQRSSPAPRGSRRDDDLHLPRAAREAARLSSADGLEFQLGFQLRQRIQFRLWGFRLRAAAEERARARG